MHHCPVCERLRERRFVEAANEFTIWACPDCGLQFSDPLLTNFRYERAYTEGDDLTGAVYTSWLDDFEERQARGRYLGSLAPEHRAGLRWLQRRLSPGQPVLDLGCGVGEFLVALRQRGFVPLGLDLAPEPITRLRQRGFSVAVGSVEHWPRSWPPPKGITLYHVLEHLPDPLGFLRDLRSRFPEALLVIAVPSPRRCSLRDGKREEFDYPPHHLTRWTETSLHRGLTSVGYANVEVRTLPVDPRELSGSGLGCVLRSWLGRRKLANPSGVSGDNSSTSLSTYSPATVLAKRLLYTLPALYRRAQGWTGGSLMGFGSPSRQA